MNNGIYAASTGLMARTQELDVAANNLANAQHHGLPRRAGQLPHQLMTASSNPGPRRSVPWRAGRRARTSRKLLEQTGNL